ALVAMAMKAGLDPATERHGWPRHDVIPFESEHRFMATLHHDHRGGAVIYLKGAPEQIMEMCSLQEREEGLEPLDRDYWRRQITDAAAFGKRTRAIAARRLGSPAAGLQWSDVEKDCTLTALVGMIDPPREEAIAAVKECHQA